MAIVIRPSRTEDGRALQEIERLASERFREVGLDLVADDGPESLEILAGYAAAGRGWTAVDDLDEPVGYVLVEDVDGNAHIEQLSVHPDFQGIGIGRALLDRVRAWAADTGRPAITLTTFASVPWNLPLWEHLGFVALTQHDVGPGLRAIRAAETARGLDVATRVCMRLDLDR